MTTLSPADSPSGSRAGKRGTMRDVAALAGVGIKTASRVVNGEPGVSPALTDRVTRAAAELHFHPDMTAGNLRRSVRRSQSLGLVLASVDNPFRAAVHRAVEDVAEQRGVAAFSASTDPVEIGRTAAERVLARLEGDDEPPRHLTVTTRLVLRGSREIPPRSTGAPSGPGVVGR